MNTILLMTNADAARTLTLVALFVLLFIVFNIGLLVYTIIKRKRAQSGGISLSSPSSETPKEETQPKAAKPFSLFKKGRQTEGCEIMLTDIAHPERSFYAEGKTEFLVGRRPQMDLCIPDDGYVSGTHCKFEITDGNLYLTDLESSNGTKLNGDKITERVQVTESDVVRIGKAEYRVNFQ